jgi:hypothetical protein
MFCVEALSLSLNVVSLYELENLNINTENNTNKTDIIPVNFNVIIFFIFINIFWVKIIKAAKNLSSLYYFNYF